MEGLRPNRIAVKYMSLTLCLAATIVLLWRPQAKTIAELRPRWRDSGGYPASIPWTSSSATPNSVRIQIVEEHHEVIPYWVDVVRSFGWQKATLIHIDAHSDFDYPEYDSHQCVGRHPTSDDEISAMMQANDQFIQSAILGQLVNTTYLLFPNWAFDGTVIDRVSIGRVNLGEGDQFCVCYQEQVDEEGLCSTRGDDVVTFNDTEIAVDQCKDGLPFHLIESDSSNATVVLRRAKSWNLNAVVQSTPNSPVILDIDEDYFGVQLVGHQLLTVGFDRESIGQIDEAIGTVFCPSKASLETEIDAWFRNLISKMKYCLLASSSAMSGKSTCVKQFWRLIKTDLFRNRFKWLCQNVHVIRASSLILSSLYPHCRNASQAQALARVGICLTNAWSTHRYESNMRLCLGHNLPGESVVDEFVPTDAQFEALLSNFTALILSLPRRPDLVTIARSSRDGYTPRSMQAKIEHGILYILYKIFNISESVVQYSPRLAGGQSGWYARE